LTEDIRFPVTDGNGQLSNAGHVLSKRTVSQTVPVCGQLQF